MKLAIFTITIIIPFVVNADSQALRLSKYIGNINMYEVIFELVDAKCLTEYSLTKEQLKYINNLTLAKTGVTYKKFNSIIGDHDLTVEMAEEAIQPILESNCNPKLLNFWYSKVSQDFDNNLAKLKKELPIAVVIK